MEHTHTYLLSFSCLLFLLSHLLPPPLAYYRMVDIHPIAVHSTGASNPPASRCVLTMAAHLHALHTLTLVFVLNYVPCLCTRDPFRPLPPLGCIYQVASKSGAIAKVRKFYKDVSVVEADTVGYGVALDGRRIKTPKGVHLTVPT